MNRDCRCGGRLRRTDIVPVIGTDGRTLYQDLDKEKATWKCVKCNKIYTQRKRQASKVVDGHPDVEKFRKRVQMHLDDNAKGTIAFFVLVDAIAEDCKRWRESECYKGDRAEKGSR